MVGSRFQNATVALLPSREQDFKINCTGNTKPPKAMICLETLSHF
jgi:hypothetical protein